MVRKILTVITLILLAVVIWGAHDQIFQAVSYFDPNSPEHINIIIVLLLIPEQLFMYYCAGQMFFSYMRAKKNAKKISPWDLMRVSLELNFVNHAIPSGGVSGLGYIAWRLNGFGTTPGQVSFMYMLRYAITICANQFQTIVAIIFLLLFGALTPTMHWIVWAVALMSVGIIAAIAIAVVIASSRKRVDWFSGVATKFLDFVVRKVTFGHRKTAIPYDTIHKYFIDLHEDLLTARRNKHIIIRPIIWGIVYSFLEVATYWIVGISLGHPEILPQIMVAEAIGSVFGAVLPLPGGVGGYEGSMIAMMALLGVSIDLATAVVITTRVIVLSSTILSGYGFYQHAISKIGKKDMKKIQEGK